MVIRGASRLSSPQQKLDVVLSGRNSSRGISRSVERWYLCSSRGSLTHAVSDFLKERGVTLHKLRHGRASHMLAVRVHPKVVQETPRPFRYGDYDIYSHLMPNMQEGAAATVDEALRAAINKHAEDVR